MKELASGAKTITVSHGFYLELDMPATGMRSKKQKGNKESKSVSSIRNKASSL